MRVFGEIQAFYMGIRIVNTREIAMTRDELIASGFVKQAGLEHGLEIWVKDDKVRLVDPITGIVRQVRQA